jgi:hypothetical protein
MSTSIRALVGPKALQTPWADNNTSLFSAIPYFLTNKFSRTVTTGADSLLKRFIPATPVLSKAFPEIYKSTVQDKDTFHRHIFRVMSV